MEGERIWVFHPTPSDAIEMYGQRRFPIYDEEGRRTEYDLIYRGEKQEAIVDQLQTTA